MRDVPCGSPNVGSFEAPGTSDTRRILVPLDIYLCTACSHVQLADIVDPDLQYSNYRYRTSISLGLAQHFGSLVQEVTGRLQAGPGALCVEIGSNDGTVLRLFQDRGYRTLGVDPAREIAAAATASGVETWAEFFNADLADRILRERGPARVIIANNVLANLEHLEELIGGIRGLLASDGVLVFETQYGVDVFEKMLLDTVYHEHISYFNVRPLRRFFAAHGLELVDVTRIATKGGSIRCTVQHQGGPFSTAPIVDELEARERLLGFDRPDAYRKFSLHTQAQRQRLHQYLDRAGAPLIAGYGASVGTVTLLHYFELADRVSVIFDDNPLLPALEGPGYRIPVQLSQALYEQQYDQMVLFAWRYADPIVARHARFLDGGGNFLVPLPDFHVLNREPGT
jgi:SAM-dependent methyltransferase